MRMLPVLFFPKKLSYHSRATSTCITFMFNTSTTACTSAGKNTHARGRTAPSLGSIKTGNGGFYIHESRCRRRGGRVRLKEVLARLRKGRNAVFLHVRNEPIIFRNSTINYEVGKGLPWPSANTHLPENSALGWDAKRTLASQKELLVLERKDGATQNRYISSIKEAISWGHGGQRGWRSLKGELRNAIFFHFNFLRY